MKYRLWDLGQQHLAGGRYVAARGALEVAEGMAWRERDAQSLARVYLPLLEARRLIRYQAAEGTIVVAGVVEAPGRAVRAFLKGAGEAGTILLAAGRGDAGAARHAAGELRQAAHRSGRRLEALLLSSHERETRLSSAGDARFAAGLAVEWTGDASRAVGLSTDPGLVVPLPPPGRYEGGSGVGVMARESLLIAWEALALKWQVRHPLARGSDAWAEMAWLRRALEIDPACEPVTMRLIAVAEGVQRGNDVGTG